ncbi:MAG: fibrobacter succinogenes major paralogous domain-containing protein, partial [Dysgonamonadaceae bacterium]|nr:fibrobacter succinogenes major paralogous domain-containing protein [Dysgonamonadaceae bacterium]
LFAKTGNDVTFALSTGASAFCSQGESYEWYKTGANDNNYTSVSETASSLTTSFSPAGTYKVKVEVTNRYTATPVEKTTTIEITANGAPPATLIDGKYGITTGGSCFDVKGSKPSGQPQAIYDSRTDAFVDGAFTKTFTFTHTNSFSDLTVLNPGGIVASVTQPAATFGSGSGSVSFTVTFVSDVKAQVIANNAPIYVQLVVSYKNNNSENRIAYKKIKVQDAACVCPAQVPTTIRSSGWLIFQCHNLGADYDITSDADLADIDATNFREYHGDWYRFGAKNVSLVNDGTYEGNPTQSVVPNWSSYPVQDDTQNWSTSNDPCPAGWQLPTNDEWAAVISSYNTIEKYTGTSGASSQTWDQDNTATPSCCYNNAMKVGDYLYLPAAGYRFYSNGYLSFRGLHGYYWSSTGSSSNAYELRFYGDVQTTLSTLRTYGFSVRCVSEE